MLKEEKKTLKIIKLIATNISMISTQNKYFIENESFLSEENELSW